MQKKKIIIIIIIVEKNLRNLILKQYQSADLKSF